MQDANGHSIAVDGKTFGDSIHGSLKCNDCHADIKEYPHPEQVAKVECKTCHADEASGAGGQRACGLEGASVHELPRERAHDLSEDRFAVGGVSAECSQDLRQLPRHRGHGEEARAGERVSAVRGLDSRIRAEQGRPAGGGQLPELPRIAPHPEPQQSAEPDLQGEHSQDLRKLPREDQRRLHGAGRTARPWPAAI